MNCARSSTDRASDYGSEGSGFESLRAHQNLNKFYFALAKYCCLNTKLILY